jgi:hypothetical protein
LVLSLDASLPAIRKQVEAILHANPLWKGGKWDVMISELGETSIPAKITRLEKRRAYCGLESS